MPLIEKERIETDLNTGRTIFENVPDDFKPFWAGLILASFNSYLVGIPNEIKELHTIIANQKRWGEAHRQFSKIRRFLLDHKNYQPEVFLLLAECVTKITYNASFQPAPFDTDSGWYIPGLAMQTARFFNNIRLTGEVQAKILLFNNNAKFKNDIEAAKKFLMYRKIDEILWFDWDPIGVNANENARDEYQSYVTEIYNLKVVKAGRKEIADYLLKIEQERMGLTGDLEYCLRTADKIIDI